MASPLNQSDLAMFERLGIPSELVERAGIFRVTNTEAWKFGFIGGSGDRSGIVFPYFSRHDGNEVCSRVRRDHPEMENNKPKNKYLSSSRDRKHLYFVPGAVIGKESTIVLVEAEKSALCATAWAERHGKDFVFVGMGGCYGWRGRIGKAVAADGKTIDEKGVIDDVEACRDHRVIIMLDSNAATNPMVRRAERELASELEARGCEVRIARIPADDGINGPDDLVMARGDEALQLVLDGARLSADCAIHDAQELVRAVQGHKDDIERIRAAIDAVGLVADPLQREVLHSKLAAILKGTVSKSSIGSEIEHNVARRKEEAEERAREMERLDLMSKPVDGPKLFADLVAYCRQYVRVGESEYVVIAAWVLHGHAFAAFTRTPYLLVSSPVRECGKTLLLEILELIAANALMTSSVTNAVLARAISNDPLPALMIDEFDELQKGDKELLASVTATLNSGYKKSGNRLILEPDGGGGWVVKRLSTYCPKIISGIGSVPDQTESRSIPVRMERLAPGDKVDDPDEYITEPQAAELKSRADAWARQHLDALRKARPDSPPELRNRQREVSRPLFAIGDEIGGEWPKRVRDAVVKLFGDRNRAPASDVGTELLGDIREAFGKLKPPADLDRMPSADLVRALRAMADRPWDTWGKNEKGLTQNGLARLLKKFKVYPGNIKMPDDRVPKGYEREWLTPVWDRYLPPLPPPPPPPPHTAIQTATPLPPASILNETQFSNRYQNFEVADEKCEIPASTLHGSGVAVEKPVWGGSGVEGGVEGSDGKVRHCRTHPDNHADWWLRGGTDPVCSLCHPGPGPNPAVTRERTK